MTERTRELIEQGKALTFSEFPGWEIFLSTPGEGKRWWALRWQEQIVCKRIAAYGNHDTWVCALRSICCGTGYLNDQGLAYCLHCGNPTPYGAEVQQRQDGQGMPIVQHARHWFEPFTDPLTAEILAQEVAQVAELAEDLIQDFSEVKGLARR